ncbi:helix-turn-helix domain-containing protein [Streptomyces olivoreticuli]|uniref:winged helix-turn-helix transcriptional regulator n=1 Tax=Streptomyces olivoreticuli TaxID=68246 RepID=UPI002659145E|nr:helix-turn-helix domain-containing protein [Streptomyces olivoreticuli]WKK24269.1 helix-turn-helix domain-containing protein [Streptomyces olivoreticuli]
METNKVRAGAGLPTRGDLRNPDCPSRDALDRLGGKWSVLIILTLASGTRRFSALRDEVVGVSAKVLTANLRDLERDGLVTRTVYAEVPPRTEYTLTPLGASLIEPFLAIQEWAETHATEIHRNRTAHDQAAQKPR